MGKRGPKPKAPEIEEAQGFPGRRKGRTKAELASRVEAGDSAHVPRAASADTADARLPDPPCHLGKTARRIWAGLFADPALRAHLKSSDHFAVANYCKLQAILAARKIPPRPTYDVPILAKEKDPDGGTSETQVGLRKKANPEYGAWLATIREVRALEQMLGLNPVARLGIEGKLARKPGDGDEQAASSAASSGGRSPGAAKSPIGIFKPRVN